MSTQKEAKMQPYQVALFGEAERGEFSTAHYCRNLPHLEDLFGNPPPESRGLYLAIQALLYKREVIYFRVKEEGFSTKDYLRGLQVLNKEVDWDPVAVCAPGVGCSEIIDAIISFCRSHHSILLITEPDLYDYLTQI